MVHQFKISNKKKELGKYCCAYGCANKPIGRKGGLCHKHYARKRRIEKPIEIRFSQFKGNAKKRGKDFTITLDQFRDFCKRTGYLSKGQRGQNATIDRRCNLHGYHIWNIQILTLWQNCVKGTGSSADCPF